MDYDTNKKPMATGTRESSKELKVVSRPSGHGRYAPSIRVAGKWLSQFGFEMDDIVVLTAKQGEINIKCKDKCTEKESSNDKEKNDRSTVA